MEVREPGKESKGRRRMSGPECCSNPPSLNPSAGTGHVDKLGDLHAYLTGSPHSNLALLLVSDVFGISSLPPPPSLLCSFFFLFVLSLCIPSLTSHMDGYGYSQLSFHFRVGDPLHLLDTIFPKKNNNLIPTLTHLF